MRYFLPFILLIVISSCSGNKKSKNQSGANNDIQFYKKNFRANVNILTYDQYASPYLKGHGAQISDKIVAVPFSLVSNASSVRFIYPGSDIEPMARGYLWYDIGQNLVFLRVSGPPKPSPDLLHTMAPKKLYGLKIINSKLKKYSVETDSIIRFKEDEFQFINNEYALPGNPLFTTNHKMAGVVSTLKVEGKDVKVLYPAFRIKEITDTLSNKVKSISNLKFKSDKVYPKSSEVKSFIIETSMGSFEIKLSDNLPEYKQNFIKLSSDGYYDSLLVHRVIRNFLIQMGAADTKYAQKDDVVGWKGPGYTLPTIIDPNLYHKRGAVAVSKPPKYNNRKNRTDGSQFYVIAGRKFSDEELDEIESNKGFKFTPQQRLSYTNIGGAPYLDKEFAVIGEVINGMNVVDSIAAVAINPKERPLKDIRIKKVRIVKK